MPSINVIRTRVNFYTGAKRTFKVFSAKHTSITVLRRIYDQLLKWHMLEGGDRVVCERYNQIIDDHKICFMCSKRFQINDSGYCKVCTSQRSNEDFTTNQIIDAQFVNEKEKKNKDFWPPHPNARFYR